MWLGLPDRPDMTLDVYRGRKTTTQQQQQLNGAPLKEKNMHLELSHTDKGGSNNNGKVEHLPKDSYITTN